MKTQRGLWIKIIIAFVIILGFIYFFFPQATQSLFEDDSTSFNTEEFFAPDGSLLESPRTEESAVYDENQPLSEAMQARIAAMQERRPYWTFSPKDVVSAVGRSVLWTASEEIPQGLPLTQQEFTDGRYFIDFDNLKMESLMPGDRFNLHLVKDGQHYPVIIETMELQENNRITWYGKLLTAKGKSYKVSFTKGEHWASGELASPEGNYTLQAHGDKGWISVK